MRGLAHGRARALSLSDDLEPPTLRELTNGASTNDGVHKQQRRHEQQRRARRLRICIYIHRRGASRTVVVAASRTLAGALSVAALFPSHAVAMRTLRAIAVIAAAAAAARVDAAGWDAAGWDGAAARC